MPKEKANVCMSMCEVGALPNRDIASHKALEAKNKNDASYVNLPQIHKNAYYSFGHTYMHITVLTSLGISY